MSIRISQKHGVNPSLLACPMCGESVGVALCGQLPEDREAPRKMLDVQPCRACVKQLNEWADQGVVLLISAPDCEKNTPHPWRYYWGVAVVKREAGQQLGVTGHAAWVTYQDAKEIGLVDGDGKLVTPDGG